MVSRRRGVVASALLPPFISRACRPWRKGRRAREDGVTDFDALHSRMNDDAAFAYAFDLLALNDADIRRHPVCDRKAQLAKLLRKAKAGIR